MQPCSSESCFKHAMLATVERTEDDVQFRRDSWVAEHKYTVLQVALSLACAHGWKLFQVEMSYFGDRLRR